MASKIKIRADQVVERSSDGNIKWISDAGELNTHAESELNIEAGVAAKADVPADAPVAASKPAKPKAPAKASSNPVTSPKAAVKPAPAPTPPVSEKPTSKAAKPAPSKPQEKIVAKAKKKSTAKGVRTIAGKEVDLSKFVKTKSAAGGASLNNGDAIAKKLDGKTLDEAYKIVAGAVKLPEADLRKKFKHLNPGMQRMNLGNMARKGPREEKVAKKKAA